MRKIILVVSSLFLLINLHAQEDKLDVLDKQSKEFFKAITGLEKDYLEEQIGNIKANTNNTTSPNRINTSSNIPVPLVEEKKISQEEYEKNVFKHENEMARITTDFTRTKKLKDIRIKSMYTFNGRDFVVLKLDQEKKKSKKDDKELSLNIEGRYAIGDSILTHRITDINTRTKTVKLYKKLDEEYGYFIHLSNYGISVSDLNKKELKKIEKSRENDNKTSKNSVKDAFKKVANKPIEELDEKTLASCLYTVNVKNLNVRNDSDINARVLRILKVNDQFTILEKRNDWLEINTIYKKKSGDVMVVDEQNNWVNITDTNVLVNDNNCL